MYPITEIFLSWQAEGYQAGLPTVFVRFAGCNYKCSWCDTDFSLRERATAEQIAERVKAFDKNCGVVPSVCFTGGEPCMHDLDKIIDLIDGPMPRLFQIETNGSMKHERFMDRAFVTVSPKKPDGEPVDGGVYTCHQLKLVYQGQDLDLFRGEDLEGKTAYHYVQPLYIPAEGNRPLSMNWSSSFEAVKRASSATWRLSFQTNKWAGAR